MNEIGRGRGVLAFIRRWWRKPNQAKAKSIGCLGSLVGCVALIAYLLLVLPTIDSSATAPAGPLGGSFYLVIFATSLVGGIGSLVVYPGPRLVGVALLLVAGLTTLLIGVLCWIDRFYAPVGVFAAIAGLTLLSALLLALQAPKQRRPQ